MLALGGRHHTMAPLTATALEDPLAQLPELASARGTDGRISYDNSLLARRSRARLGDARGVLIRLSLGRRRALVALAAVVRLYRAVRRDGAVVRSTVGLGGRGAAYLFAVCPSATAAVALLEGAPAQAVARRWTGGYWASVCAAENEFGHWDGLHLRTYRARRRVEA